MSKSNPPKEIALSIILLNYIIAILGAWVYLKIDNSSHPLWALFFADVLATLIIFIGSCIFKNASFYDPYWSIIPILFVLYWFEQNPASISDLFMANNYRPFIVGLLVFIWGGRLTLNWIREFTGLNYEDWRYRNFRKNYPDWFWLVNLTGIQLFPTILVFLGSMSLYASIAQSSAKINFLDLLGIIITAGAILIETIADQQMWRYRQRRDKKSSIIQEGLWRRSRHPNYFGEVMFWWGLFFFAIGNSLSYWWTIIGPVAITLLFLFISIPMIEKRHQKRKPEYAEYIEKVPKFIPKINKK